MLLEQQRCAESADWKMACDVHRGFTKMAAPLNLPRVMRASPDPLSIAETLSSDFAATAVQRDRRGGTPKQERNAIRESGLLTLIVPKQFGGWGASWTTALQAVRILARSDGSIAHVFGFQHLLLATVRLFGTSQQFELLARGTIAARWFWGNALNPLDTRVTIGPGPDGHVLRGEKSFCSGARDADVLVVSAIDSTGKLVVAAIPADRAGITARDDWDNMGQRQTDSGSVLFEDVRVSDTEILADPGPLGSTFATLRPLIAQLTLCNVYLGISEAALGAAKDVTRDRGRAWFASGVERAADDPYILATFGDLFAQLEAARHLTESAATVLDRAWLRGESLTPEERGECAVSIAAAKVITTGAGLDISTRIFDATGARGTTARLGLDRFWRDLRTHTLHDPVDYKRRDIGRF
ncbi:MAG: acyl-CoA dehydrogenase family protein, partial [Polyangiaceae bacterium]